jgi:hypothetical protein
VIFVGLGIAAGKKGRGACEEIKICWWKLRGGDDRQSFQCHGTFPVIMTSCLVTVDYVGHGIIASRRVTRNCREYHSMEVEYL